MSEKHKLLLNSLSMVANRLVQGVSTFILTAAIARNLGADALGAYLLSISFYYIFVNISSQGFKTLFTREIAREPEATPVYLVSGTLLQFIFSVIAYVALVVVVFLLPYSADTSSLCYITGLTVVPFALSNITEAVFQAQEKMHLIAISTIPVYILRLLAMLWIMQLNYGIEYVTGILVISESLILVIEWLIMINIIKIKWQIKQDFIWNTIKAARTFVAIEGMGIVASKVDILILSLLGSEFLLGLYGIVNQLMQPFYILANSLASAAFPRMSKAVSLGKENQRQEAENLIKILLCMSLPFLLGLLFYGKELMLFIYHNPSFTQAIFVLNLTALTLITSSFTRTFSYVLIANGFEKFNLIEVTITTILGSLAGIILITEYKLLGAALMALAMSFTNFSILMYAVYSRLFTLRFWRVMRLPLLISSLMLIVFLILQKINLDFSLTLIVATCAYSVFAFIAIAHKLSLFNYGMAKIFKKHNP
jgi:O-antigen/teichoic acid export membrane protein